MSADRGALGANPSPLVQLRLTLEAAVPTIVERFRTIRDGIAAGCTPDELYCDVEVLASVIEVLASVLERGQVE